MCKRCSELEIEIDAAEEYGFGLTSFQLREELEALQASHLPNKACSGQADTVAPKCTTEKLCPVHNVWHASPPRK